LVCCRCRCLGWFLCILFRALLAPLITALAAPLAAPLVTTLVTTLASALTSALVTAIPTTAAALVMTIVVTIAVAAVIIAFSLAATLSEVTLSSSWWTRHDTARIDPEAPAEARGELLDVHEVALRPSAADVLVELPTTSLMEVSHRRELRHDRSSSVEATIESCERLRRSFLILEHAVDVADELIGEVIHDMHCLDFAKLREFFVHIFIKLLEVVDEKLGVDVQCCCTLRHGVLVHVGEEQTRTVGWFEVKPGAAVSVAAGAHLGIERTVNAVLFRTEETCVLRCATLLLTLANFFRYLTP